MYQGTGSAVPRRTEKIEGFGPRNGGWMEHESEDS
ncbi:hypothetical protein ACP_2682 [Acidobacterium capsulatum ATCC 51196]|uniref:Uncharacterized protein n=1 Tax=Acidobacterium capsulatum (strain ATCC 51196 / DSM 11244 / BCRC 80197 / JCM 7670 / NBRC 15755 / NCIMB 13165 / 161) TaxID=240015 RepID=C1F2M2_ACIC5|nr:hypothetical protein ACP_2682 [Acidobacterium capsulatum ATCC 51196]